MKFTNRSMFQSNNRSAANSTKFAKAIRAALLTLVVVGANNVSACAQHIEPKPAAPTDQTAAQDEPRAKTVFDQAAAASKQLNSASTVAERREIIVKFEEAAKLWQAANNQKQQIAALNEVGSGYLQINEFASAIENYRQALTLTRAANNKLGELPILIGLGSSYEKANEPQTAIEHYKQALVILESAEFANNLPAETAAGNKPSESESPKAAAESSKALMLLYIAAIHGKAKEHKQALDYYQQAWTVVTAAKIYDSYAAAGALIGVTQTFLDLNQPSGATAFLDQEIARARAAKNVELEAVLTEFAAQIKSGSRKLKY